MAKEVIAITAVRGEGHLPDLLEEREPVEPGEANIGDHHVEAGGRDLLEASLAVRRGDNLVPGLPKGLFHRIADVGVVFHHQDMQHGTDGSVPGRPPRGGVGRPRALATL